QQVERGRIGPRNGRPGETAQGHQGVSVAHGDQNDTGDIRKQQKTGRRDRGLSRSSQRSGLDDRRSTRQRRLRLEERQHGQSECRQHRSQQGHDEAADKSYSPDVASWRRSELSTADSQRDHNDGEKRDDAQVAGDEKLEEPAGRDVHRRRLLAVSMALRISRSSSSEIDSDVSSNALTAFAGESSKNTLTSLLSARQHAS